MNYDWRCQACDHAEKSGNDLCTRCGCPALSSGDEVEKYKKAWLHTEAAPEKSSYRCPKCDHHLHESGEVRTAGGAISAIFDIATERFLYVACCKCGYTEFYKKETGQGSIFLDAFIGRPDHQW